MKENTLPGLLSQLDLTLRSKSEVAGSIPAQGQYLCE